MIRRKKTALDDDEDGYNSVQKHITVSKNLLKIPYICTNNRYFTIGYRQYNTNFSIFSMKRREIKRPQHVDGKGLIKQIEYLRILHNVSKDALEKLAGYFGYKVTLTLEQ